MIPAIYWLGKWDSFSRSSRSRSHLPWPSQNMRPCRKTDHYFLLAVKEDLFVLKKNTFFVKNLLNPRPAGPLDFPPPAGGGGVWTPPPPWSRLLVAVEKNESQRSKAREKPFRNHFGHFWLRSKLGSPGVKIPKFSKTVFRQ